MLFLCNRAEMVQVPNPFMCAPTGEFRTEKEST